MTKYEMSSKQIEKRVQELRPVKKLIPVTKWSDYYDWPTIPGLRAMIFNSASNGFETCIKRVGRRVLISPSEFFACVERLNNKGAKK